MPILETTIIAGFFTVGDLLTAIAGGVGTGIGLGLGWKVADKIATWINDFVDRFKYRNKKTVFCGGGDRDTFATVVKFLDAQNFLTENFTNREAHYHRMTDSETEISYTIMCDAPYKFKIPMMNSETSTMVDCEVQFAAVDGGINGVYITLDKNYNSDIIAQMNLKIQ
jgi:hypothetical protein